MYVDDRLGRRSRARSGLDQLDLAEDLLGDEKARSSAAMPVRLREPTTVSVGLSVGAAVGLGVGCGVAAMAGCGVGLASKPSSS